eukprot:evm.model.scf_1129.1 EVM.evm.TU.scf_1129.1   scf_1129:2455-5702(-)
MIFYSKTFFDLDTCSQLYGSAFPRALFLALLGTAASCAVWFGFDHDDVRKWYSAQPIPFEIFAFVVTFALVFRNNLAYVRFWEGRTQLQLMTSKLTDVAIMVLIFDRETLPRGSGKISYQRARVFGESFLHFISLLHAVALQSLRLDWDLDNLCEHDHVKGMPPATITLQRSMKRAAVRKWCEHKPWWKRLRFAVLAGNSWFPTDMFHLRWHPVEMNCLNKMLPLGVVAGVTEKEKVALGKGWPAARATSRGHPTQDGIGVPGPSERVQVVYKWICDLILDRRREGGLRVEPPLLTRCFQVLSQGMEGYAQCRKLAETPFPFPYVQFIIGGLVAFSIMFSITVNSYIHVLPLNLAITFMTMICYFALNELAKDMEDPFIHAPNDLPIARYHYKFNERIVAMARTKRPASHSEMCIVRLRTLREEACGSWGVSKRSMSLTGAKMDGRVGGPPLDTDLPKGLSVGLPDIMQMDPRPADSATLSISELQIDTMGSGDQQHLLGDLNPL